MNYNQQLRWVIDAVLAGYHARDVEERAAQSVHDLVRSMRDPTVPQSFTEEDFRKQLYNLSRRYSISDVSPSSVSNKIRRYTAQYLPSTSHENVLIHEYDHLAIMRDSLVIWSHTEDDVEQLFDHLESIHGAPHKDKTRYFPILLDMALSLYEAAHAVHCENDVPWAWRSPILYAAWKERFRVRDGAAEYLAPVYDLARQQREAELASLSTSIDNGRRSTTDLVEKFVHMIPPGSAKSTPNIESMLQHSGDSVAPWSAPEDDTVAESSETR